MDFKIGQKSTIYQLLCVKGSLTPVFQYFLLLSELLNFLQITPAAIVLTSDIDVHLHMNNSRYQYQLDFVRVRFFLETNAYRVVRARKGFGLMSAVASRYRMALNLFQRYQIKTKVSRRCCCSSVSLKKFAKHAMFCVKLFLCGFQRINFQMNNSACFKNKFLKFKNIFVCNLQHFDNSSCFETITLTYRFDDVFLNCQQLVSEAFTTKVATYCELFDVN